MEEPRAIWKCLLDIAEPWTVNQFKVDRHNKRVDVWVGIEMPRSWFGLGRARAPEQHPTHSWRHTNMGEWRFYIHVSVPPGADLDRYRWAGEVGMPFTRGLALKIFSLFNEGASLRGICSLLNLPLSDVWRYRFALDNGKLAAAASPSGAAGAIGITAAPPPEVTARPAEAPGIAVGEAANAAVSALMAEGGRSDNVPDVSDPVWQQLIEGRLDLDIRVLSLKLLLTRTRTQFGMIADDEVRMLKLRELHRYFQKNERMLGYELDQLRAEAS